MVKNSNFFELFGPPCGNALADLDGSTSEFAQVCALHIVWTTFGSAKKNRNGSCPMHVILMKFGTQQQIRTTMTVTWSNIKNFTTQNNHPPFFEFLTPPPPAPWADGPQRGRGTSADIVPTHMKLGVDPSTRYWDIAQKPPKCTNSPVTKISFPPFSAPRGR